MARQKTVFKPSELAGVWIRQGQDNGRTAGNGNFYFSGRTIWSYGSHFPIATILDNGDVVMTTQTYSNTTSGHISWVRGAVRNRTVIMAHDIFSHEASLKDWYSKIDDLKEQIQKKSNRKFEGRVSQLRYYAQQLKDYTDYFKIILPFDRLASLLFILSDQDIAKELRA